MTLLSSLHRLSRALAFAGWAMVCLVAAQTAGAATYQWNGSSSTSWTLATNWNGTGNPAGVTLGPAPTGGNTTNRVNVNNNGDAYLLYDAARGTTLLGGAGVRGLVIGSGTSGNLRLTGGTLATTNSSGAGTEDVLGSGVAGTFTNDGGNYAAWVLRLGLNNGSGNGTFTMNAGTATISNIAYNYQGGGSATVELNGGTLTTRLINELVTDGFHVFHFNGGTLSPWPGSDSTLAGGLSRVSVRNGGAVFDTPADDFFVESPMLHSTNAGDAAIDGGLVKNGAATLTLRATNSYTGPTRIAAGTLALGAGGLLPTGSVVSVAAGAVFDVSARSNHAAVARLHLSGSSGTCAVLRAGTVLDLGTQPVSLVFTPGTFNGDLTRPAARVTTGSVTMSGAVTVTNAGGSPLGVGTYRLLEQSSGVLSGAPVLAGAVAGQGIAAGKVASLVIDGAQLNLVVSDPFATVTTLARRAGTTSSNAYGTVLAFDVTVSPTGAVGLVELRNGGAGGTVVGTAPLTAGASVLTLEGTALPAGTHSNLVARFPGDGTNSASTSPPLGPPQIVARKALTLSGTVALDKLFDGSTAATLTNGTLVGVEAGDAVSVSLLGVFASAGPGIGIAVTSTSMLSGADAGNYTLTQPAGLSATIFDDTFWTGAAGDTFWNTTNNWSGGVIPTGAGESANFANLDITSDQTVRLNGARTIGRLTFGDLATGSGASWTLTNNGTAANTLTLAGATPAIDVRALGAGEAVTVGAVLAGSGGLTKLGAGTLVLTGTNTFSGGARVFGGVLAVLNDARLGVVPAVPTAGHLTIDGGILEFLASGTISSNRGIAVGPAGATLRFAGGTTTFDGAVTGAGLFTLEAVTNTSGLLLTGESTHSGGMRLTGPGTVYPRRGSVGPAGSPTAGPFGTGTLTFAGPAMRPSISSGLDLELANPVAIEQDVTFPTTSSEWSLTFSGPVRLTNGTRRLTVDLGTTVSGKAVAMSGGIHANGQPNGLIKDGDGPLLLSGVNTYTGPTIVTNGRLRVDAPGSLHASSTVYVEPGAVLGGDGTIHGPVIVESGGILEPGSDTAGTLTVNGALTLGGTLRFTLNRTNSPNVGTLAVPGVLNLTGSVVFITNGPALQAGDTFNLLDAAGFTNQFNSFALPPLGWGLVWQTNQLRVNGTISVITSANTSIVTLTTGTVYQTMYGIGGNFCQGDQRLLNDYNRYNELFSESGLNFSFIRLSTSLEMTNTRFAGYDAANVAVTENFRAMQPSGYITLTTWSPPEVLKTTRSAYQGTIATNSSGQYLYTNYANWWTRVMQYYQSNSALPDFVSIQNEPDFTPSGTSYAYEAGCYVNSSETSTRAGYPQALAAVKTALQAAGLGSTRFIGPDTTAIAGNKIPTYLNNLPTGSVVAIAHHLYHDDPATSTSALSTLDSQYPYATWPKFMTELNPYDQFESPAFDGQPDWMQLAVTMHNVFVYERANAYLVWNVMYATIGYWNGQPVGTATYHPLGHYSKFIRPGDRRALATSSDTDVLVSMYRRTNAPGIAPQYTIVLINKGATHAFPTITTSNLWPADSAQRSWKLYMTGNDGAAKYRLTLRENEAGAMLTGNRQVVLPPYSIATAILNTGTSNNAPPSFTGVVSNYTISAGQTLVVSNLATDPNQPAQILTYTLPTAPGGSVLTTTNGTVTWRPTVAQGGATHPFTVVVSDNGSPILSDTQSYNVTVRTVTPPTVVSMGMITASNGSRQFQMQIDGEAGPDYTIQASTNLQSWTNLATTTPSVLPYLWTDLNSTNLVRRFYRVLRGP
jgi:autotransporter-associated beta strand protein